METTPLYQHLGVVAQSPVSNRLLHQLLNLVFRLSCSPEDISNSCVFTSNQSVSPGISSRCWESSSPLPVPPSWSWCSPPRPTWQINHTIPSSGGPSEQVLLRSIPPFASPSSRPGPWHWCSQACPSPSQSPRSLSSKAPWLVSPLLCAALM